MNQPTKEQKQKVEELVEWVADGISVAQCSVCGKSGEICKGCGYLVAANILACKLLSHPDLALIDREHELPEVWAGIPLSTETKSRLQYIIPLAEALKETQSG